MTSEGELDIGRQIKGRQGQQEAEHRPEQPGYIKPGEREEWHDENHQNREEPMARIEAPALLTVTEPVKNSSERSGIGAVESTQRVESSASHTRTLP